MHRFIAAFLLLLTLLMPGIGAAGGVGAGDAIAPSGVTLLEEAALGLSASGHVSDDRDSAMSADGVDRVDGSGDMPILLQSPRAPGTLRSMAEALPSFRRIDAPAPWIAGLRRPPRPDSVSA